jgi:outer membrane lipoprotein-sorting protein
MKPCSAEGKPVKLISKLFILIALTALQPNIDFAAVPDATASAAAAASEVSEQVTNKILGNMEYLRGFRGTGFHFTAEVITVENGANSDQHQLEVKISDKGYALVEVLEPKNQRGRRTLLRERDLWLYLPSSANIIRIAPLQRVFGAASIADVLNVSYLNDYTVQSSHKTADGKLLQLSLKSKDSSATYARIDLDYDLATDRPVESRHYTASERLLKTIQYKAFHDYSGGPKIEKIAIVDGIRASSAVWMKMSEYEKAAYPDSMFTKTALSRN